MAMVTWFVLAVALLVCAEADACPPGVSVQELRAFAQMARECVQSLTQLTGSAPQLPAFLPDPACPLSGLNLMARTLEFRASACQALLQDRCPSSVTVEQLKTAAAKLRDCVSMMFGRVGREVSFPDFTPPPACRLSGINLFVAKLNFRLSVCQDLLEDQACAQSASSGSFQQAARRLLQCRQQFQEKTQSPLLFPDFPQDPECFPGGLRAHMRVMTLKIRFCQQQLDDL